MSALFAPLRLRGIELPNRAWVSPMCMYACEDHDGVVGDWHVMHYGQYALGGAGLILTEATAVLPEGRVTPQDAGIWSDAQAAAWRRVTESVHLTGGRIGVQLAHAGRKGGKYRGLPGDEFVARSVPLDAGGWVTTGATDAPFGHYDPPRPATAEYLAVLPAAFAAAARRADAAGFDVIELHGAHGYLLHELLSPVTNTREDEWGRDAEGRERLLLEVVDAVRAAWPEEKPLLLRVSSSDVTPAGRTPDDTAELAARLLRRGVDLVDCSAGGLVAGAEYAPGPGYQVAPAALVRAAGVPVAAVGEITSSHQAETIVATGQADAVMIGRAMLRDPYWARHAAIELGAPVPQQPQYHRAYRRDGAVAR
ncbi:MAG TPA: tRNA-dihydrouridine synthase [Gryllotalpicola sp.]